MAAVSQLISSWLMSATLSLQIETEIRDLLLAELPGMTYTYCRPQLSRERAVEISSLWAAEPPSPALDQSMLLHLQAMSGPARSAAHWRSTKEHIRLHSPSWSSSFPIFFFLSHAATFAPAGFIFLLFKPHQGKIDEHRLSVSGLSLCSRAVWHHRGSPKSLIHFFSAFIFILPKLGLVTCCIVFLPLFLSVCLFLPYRLILFIRSVWTHCQKLWSLPPLTPGFSMFGQRGRKLLIINSRTNQLSLCQSQCVRGDRASFSQ